MNEPSSTATFFEILALLFILTRIRKGFLTIPLAGQYLGRWSGDAFVAGQIRAGIDKSLAVVEEVRKVISPFGQRVSNEFVEEMLHRDGKLKS
jgi:hypothetical protein